MDCTVITPVGPGHEQLVNRAIGSAMMAAEENLGPFKNIHILAGLDDGRGRSAVRNYLLKYPMERMLVRSTGDDPQDAYRSEWLFFLDADDVMCNKEIWGTSPFGTVEPFIEDFDCIWGPIVEIDREHNISKRMQSEVISSYKEFLFYHPFQSVQIGHFVRRKVFPGFNEDMEYCEDVDLYIREWRDLRCIKQEVPLFINWRGHHTWSESEGPNGRDWSIKSVELIKEARRIYRSSKKATAEARPQAFNVLSVDPSEKDT